MDQSHWSDLPAQIAGFRVVVLRNPARIKRNNGPTVTGRPTMGRSTGAGWTDVTGMRGEAVHGVGALGGTGRVSRRVAGNKAACCWFRSTDCFVTSGSKRHD